MKPDKRDGADKMMEAVEKAFGLLSDEESAALAENCAVLGTLSEAMVETNRMLYQYLVSGRQLKRTQDAKLRFAQTQVINASLIQKAFALGILEGQKRTGENG